MTFLEIQAKIERLNSLDFGDIFNKSFELFKKTWVQGFLLILFTLIILAPFIIALYMPMYASLVEEVKSGDYDPNDFNQNVLNQMESVRIMIIGVSFFIGVISIMLTAGFFNVLRKIDFGGTFNVSDFFQFFKGKHLLKIFTIAGFTLLISLLTYALEKLLPQGLATLINSVISIALSVYTSLFIVFFAFNPELRGIEIIKASFNLGTKKWLLIFGLLFVSVLLAFICGFIACGIGILFTMSFIYLPTYFVYKEAIGFEDHSEIEHIGIE